VKLGIPRLDGGAAVRAMAEAITLVHALSGGGDPVTFDGEFYQVSELDPAAAPVLPRVTPPRRRRRGRGGPGPGGDHQRLQLRRPHHPRTS
jgi:hypothetical protein